eukprot:524897-Amorphochlora_amoeboformis.AAC.2
MGGHGPGAAFLLLLGLFSLILPRHTPRASIRTRSCTFRTFDWRLRAIRPEGDESISGHSEMSLKKRIQLARELQKEEEK